MEGVVALIPIPTLHTAPIFNTKLLIYQAHCKLAYILSKISDFPDYSYVELASTVAVFKILWCKLNPSLTLFSVLIIHDGYQVFGSNLVCIDKQDFSVLSPVVPWETDDIWRIYAGYFFVLHIPLSFGGLCVVAKVLQCSSLDPMTTVGDEFLLNNHSNSLCKCTFFYGQ